MGEWPHITSVAHEDCDQKGIWRMMAKYAFGMSYQECFLPNTFFCLPSGTPCLDWRRHSSKPSRTSLTHHHEISVESHGFSRGKPVWTEHLSVYQNNMGFLPLLVICSLVSWLEADHSLSSLFITVTQSGVLDLQWVLINDSSWQLKAFRRMIFQFWAEIQTATQKYHSYISAPPSPLILYPQW